MERRNLRWEMRHREYEFDVYEKREGRWRKEVELNVMNESKGVSGTNEVNYGGRN